MSPWSPKRVCCHPGCGQLCDGGRCPKHQRQERKEYDARRRHDPRHSFYWTAEWRRTRSEHLRQEPYCRLCAAEGKTVEAQAVDHVIPVTQNGAKFDHENLRSLCASHHSFRHAKDGSRYGG